MDSLHRWTHVAVIFNNIECPEGSSICKMELSVYIGGVLQEKRVVTHRYHLKDMVDKQAQLTIGSDAFGVSTLTGELATIVVCCCCCVLE